MWSNFYKKRKKILLIFLLTGGRRGAAVLCELLPQEVSGGSGGSRGYDGGYPDYYSRQRQQG